MPWVKCLSPQNTSGVSGVNSIAAEVNCPLLRTNRTIQHNIPPYCSCGVIQVCVKPKCPQMASSEHHTHSHPMATASIATYSYKYKQQHIYSCSSLYLQQFCLIPLHRYIIHTMFWFYQIWTLVNPLQHYYKQVIRLGLFQPSCGEKIT